MSIASMFEPETLIMERFDALFPTDMIFSESDATDLDNETFAVNEIVDDRVGCIVVNAGYRSEPLVGNNRNPQQKIKMLWQVVVICPRELYATVGGGKMLEVIAALKGYRLSSDFDYMQLIDDERGFNRPEYANDIAYLPMMFSVSAVI